MKEKKKFNVKNLFKNSIFTFILGALIFGTIGVGATTLLYSKDITYDNSSSGLSSTNLQDALDELYEQAKNAPSCDSEGNCTVTCPSDKPNYVATSTGYKCVAIWTFSSSDNAQEFVVPKSGTYKIELWGSRGAHGNSNSSYSRIPGKGGYVSGNIKLTVNEKIFVRVGKVIEQVSPPSLTAIQLDSDNSYSSIMIAGAGGSSDWSAGTAGSAGGLVGYTTSLGSGTGGTQIKGGTFTYGEWVGSFLNGGYYAGGAHMSNSGGYGTGSGGSSSFISGHAGCVAIEGSNSNSPRLDSNGVACDSSSSKGYNSAGYNTDITCSYHYSGYKFTDTVMIDGLGYEWTTTKGNYVGMPTFDGMSTMDGNNTTNGYAKITFIN